MALKTQNGNTLVTQAGDTLIRNEAPVIYFPVSQKLSCRYSVKGLVKALLGIRYSLRVSVQRITAISYSITNRIQNKLQLVYSVGLPLVTQSLDVLYRIKSAAKKKLVINYAIFSWVNIKKKCSVKYTIHPPIKVKNLDVLYTIQSDDGIYSPELSRVYVVKPVNRVYIVQG